MRNRCLLICIALLITAFFLQGCSKEDQVTGPAESTQLELPSVNTMAMDLTFFESAEIDAQSVSLGRLDEFMAKSSAGTKWNFLNAAVRVLFIDVVVFAAISHPVAAFTTAIHSVPQYQEDGSWLWTYVYVDNNTTEYSIFLRGKRMETYVAWSMEVSTNDPNMPLDHFVWFEGEVQHDGLSGYWQFYEPGESATASSVNKTGTPGIQCIRIDWENNSRIDKRLAFLINKPDVPEEGSTLIFDEELEMAMIEFYNAENDETGTIIWNRDGSGSIEWPDYNDGVMGCWDVWQFDIECP